MAESFKRLTDFLVEQGVEQVNHTGKSYLAHLIGVYKLLEAQGFSEELCRAGMFHSIYGTQRFQGFKLPLESRPELRSLIGERAERLAYLNCAMERSSFDQAVPQQEERSTIIDRLTDEKVTLSRNDFDDLCRIHFYDFLEQVPRSREWDYRREAYRRMAERLGESALQAYDRVFAAEKATAIP
jgi:(p)ppGpp synthase/HD superfamily hydrolase